MSGVDLATESLSDLEVLARTIYGEARGENLAGQEAVASVILNRNNSGVWWWGRGIRSICLMPYQFSCWLVSDPNREKLLAVTPKDPVYQGCLVVAEKAISGELEDNTKGADSYRRVGTPASWAKGLVPIVTIGHHEFFCTIKKKQELVS